MSDIEKWQQQRHAELSAPDSWLGLIGLFWLEPGVNRVGNAADAGVRLPSGPAHLGELLWDEQRILWHPAGGEVVELETDRHGQPATVNHENLSFFVVDRDGRFVVRLRDRNWAATRAFAGLSYFPADEAWRIVAAWEALEPPLSMAVPNVTGDLKTVTVTHQAVFEHAGQRVALLPMSIGSNEVFFIFRDRTSGKECYGTGRFLKAPPAVNGVITLNFNFAYNPPCAFTPFALCPLPPPENWLTFAVTAGEKKP